MGKIIRTIENGKLVAKECYGCRKVKPIEKFDRNPCAGDGRQTRCRNCIAKQAAKKRKKKELENLIKAFNLF